MLCGFAPVHQVAIGDCLSFDPFLVQSDWFGHGQSRRRLALHIDIDRLSDEEIHDILITADLTPRKRLRFKTPFEGILQELGKDVQIRFS